MYVNMFSGNHSSHSHMSLRSSYDRTIPVNHQRCQGVLLLKGQRGAHRSNMVPTEGSVALTKATWCSRKATWRCAMLEMAT